MIEDIRYDSFTLSQFVTEVCTMDYSKITPVEEVFDAYMMHCRVVGVNKPMSQRAFTRAMSSSALQITKKRVMHNGERNYVFYGIGIDADKLSKMRPKPRGFNNVTDMDEARKKAAGE